MQLVDNICYEYRGRLSIMEALNMPIGDLMLLYKFIRDRREAADAAAEKEKNIEGEMQKNKYIQAAYRGHPQGGITGTPDGPSTKSQSIASMTREDIARFEDALEGMV